MLVYNEIRKGTDPKRIIELLSADPAFQSGSSALSICRAEPRVTQVSATATSRRTSRTGPRHADLLLIQGNILRPGEVIPNAVKAFINTPGALTDRVMAALEIADQYGGDSRCTCPPLPADGKPAIPCEGKTSHVAYITMSERGDVGGEGAPRADSTWAHNNGKYKMYITVTQPGQGGPNEIKPGENLNPVKTLRMRYNAWRKLQPASFK
jgi:hypothetical protein